MKNGLINTLNKQEASDALVDLGDALMDTQFNDGLLKDIPFIGMYVKIKNFGLSVSDHMLLKKSQKFIFELNNIPKQEKERFFTKLDKNEKYKSRVNDNLILLIM